MTLTTLLERPKILVPLKVRTILHTGTETLVGSTRRVLPLSTEESRRGAARKMRLVPFRACNAYGKCEVT